MTRNDPRKALGKGLHALLPARNAAQPAAPSHPAPHPAAPVPETNVQTLPIEHLAPNPNQPRREFDQTALMELAQSIERDGVIQPIIVRRTGPGAYQIIAGERRWRAAKSAGLNQVPVIVRTADDNQVLELAIVENIQREDLNPIELAIAFQRMATELGMSHEQIGQRTGKDRVTITNAVRLLQLPEPIRQLIASKQLSPGHARALLKLPDEALQIDIANKCIAGGWSVRQIEEFTRPRETTPKTRAKKLPQDGPADPNVKFALSEMERVLGTKVRITENSSGGGRIEIEFYSGEDLSRIYDLIISA
jgi:ParB family transcriptional regulator, chromosome partitioning protein